MARKKKAKAEKKAPDMAKVAAAVQQIAKVQLHVAAELKSIARVLNAELGLELELAGLTAAESERLGSVPTPMGEAKSSLDPSEVPPPQNGEHYTAEELTDPGTFTRPVLAKILEVMGGDPKGLMPPDLRTAILEIDAPSNLGTCDFTEFEGVHVEEVEYDGETYNCGPAVIALFKKKKAKTEKKKRAIVQALVDGDIEV